MNTQKEEKPTKLKFWQRWNSQVGCVEDSMTRLIMAGFGVFTMVYVTFKYLVMGDEVTLLNLAVLLVLALLTSAPKAFADKINFGKFMVK